MRGKIAKQLRKVARIHCQGESQLVEAYYADLKRAWRELHRQGKLSRVKSIPRGQ